MGNLYLTTTGPTTALSTQLGSVAEGSKLERGVQLRNNVVHDPNFRVAEGSKLERGVQQEFLFLSQS